MDGFCAMYYTGETRAGHAVFILKDGFISGADAMGGVLDGAYQIMQDGGIEVSAVLKSDSDTWFGTESLAEEKDSLVQKIAARLP